jgi:hypothetical protein
MGSSHSKASEKSPDLLVLLVDRLREFYKMHNPGKLEKEGWIEKMADLYATMKTHCHVSFFSATVTRFLGTLKERPHTTHQQRIALSVSASVPV